jgi:hypothetical protein
MANQNTKRDQNRVTGLLAEADSSGEIRALKVSEATDRLKVDAVISSGGSAGTEYTEGDVDATITGSAVMMEVAANTLQPIQGTVADGLLVNLGTNNDVTLGAALPAGTNNIGDVDVASWNGTTVVTGAGNATGALRVTLPTNGTGVIASISTSVTPGTAAANLGKAEDAAHGSGDVGVMALGVRNDAGAAFGADNDYVPLSIDSAGALRVTGGGGGTQYTEGDTDASVTGTALLWEDTADTLRVASAAKPFPVEIIAGAGSGGTAIADDAAFTVGTTSITPVGGTYKSTRDSVNDNDAGAFAMSATRALYTVIETPNGDSAMDDTNDAVKVNIVAGSSSGTQYTEGDTDASITGTAMLFETNTGTSALGVVSATNPLPISDNGGAITVDGTVAATQSGTWNVTNVSGAVSLPTGASTLAEQQSQTTHLATIAGDTTDIETAVELIDDAIIADDAVFTPATTKVMMAGFEFDDTTPDSVNEGDAGAARMSANRNVYVNIRDNAGNERGLNIDASGRLTALSVQSGTWTLGANSGVDIGDVTLNNLTSTPVFTQHNITALGHGVTTVTTAGTDVALAASTACKRVVIQSQTDNTGLIAVGATGVDATEATGTGIILYPGDAFELETDNLADIFIDSTVNGEGVRYTYFT